MKSPHEFPQSLVGHRRRVTLVFLVEGKQVSYLVHHPLPHHVRLRINNIRVALEIVKDNFVMGKEFSANSAGRSIYRLPMSLGLIAYCGL